MDGKIIGQHGSNSQIKDFHVQDLMEKILKNVNVANLVFQHHGHLQFHLLFQAVEVITPTMMTVLMMNVKKDQRASVLVMVQ